MAPARDCDRLGYLHALPAELGSSYVFSFYLVEDNLTVRSRGAMKFMLKLYFSCVHLQHKMPVLHASVARLQASVPFSSRHTPGFV